MDLIAARQTTQITPQILEAIALAELRATLHALGPICGAALRIPQVLPIACAETQFTLLACGVGIVATLPLV